MEKSYPHLVFEETALRTDCGPIRYGETGFDFLNRMGKESSHERRLRVNQLFAKYPEGTAKYAMWRQLTAPRTAAFDEFVFELQVHEFLINNGVSILEIEAPANNSKKPDFLCSHGDSRFYAEVVTVHNVEEHAAQLDRLQSDLDYLSRRKWKADLVVVEYSDESPLDVHSIRKELGCAMFAHKAQSSFFHQIKRPGWQLHFYLEKTNRIRQQFVGTTDYGVTHPTTRQRIHGSVSEKASKYGKLDFPLVIFANIHTRLFSRLDDGYDAVCGRDHLEYVPVKKGNKSEHAWVRRPDGVFYKSSQTAQLDSVVFFDNARGCSLAVPPHVRVINPLCTDSLPQLFSQTPSIQAAASERPESA